VSPQSSPLPVAVSLGDADGVGPEVLRKALADPRVDPSALRLFGPRAALEAAPGPKLPAALDWVEHPDPSGAAALAAACDELVGGRACALVTGPIDKARVAAVLGQGFVGQTEYVAERFGQRGREVMMLAGDRLRVALLTTHLPLRQVAERISVTGTLRVLRTLAADLRRWFGVAAPRLGLCALNPHAGDHGHLGHEEQDVLCPAVAQAQAEGLQVDGPWPADSLFHHAQDGRWDAVVAVYHDQGLGPLKALAFRDAINLTLGLPALRVSPDHGVARDIAGQGVADPESTVRALTLALAQRPLARPAGGAS